MKELLSIMEKELSQGKSLVLVTVTAASGAVPRGAGARMLVGETGYLGGTIGGGAVEYRAQEIAMEVLRDGRSHQRNFSLTREDVQNLGMICGGDVRVFFQYVPACEESHYLVVDARCYLDAGKPFWLLSELSASGQLQLITRETAEPWLLPFLGKKPQRFTCEGTEYYMEQIGQPGKTYIFGGGHVSRELVPVLSHVGFRCIVLDDRPEFADAKLFPTAEQVLCVDLNHLENLDIGPEDFVCILTRGHAYDTAVEAQILKFHPKYNGMIGSRAKGAAVRKALEEYGYTKEEIDTIVSPIGLSIGAQTPAEIAISIAAQMIAKRAEA